jgi:hypothetical protein
MKMDKKYIRRRRAVFAIIVFLITALFTYATRDVCYVGLGQPGTHAGYGSCSTMIDNVISEGR